MRRDRRCGSKQAIHDGKEIESSVPVRLSVEGELLGRSEEKRSAGNWMPFKIKTNRVDEDLGQWLCDWSSYLVEYEKDS